MKLPCAPSKIIPCNPKECAGCALAGQCQGKCLESRYEIDAEITVVVRKHSQMEYLCPKSNTCLRGIFPENITATKCYGPKIQALAIGMNILQHYKGIVIHDCWRPYWKFQFEAHGLCCAHILRVLQGVIDNNPKQEWAELMIWLLCKMKSTKEKLMDTRKTSASAYNCRLYKGYIYQGRQNNPIEYSDKRKRKRNIARRLADRLNEYSEDFCRFFWDFRVPFDNNQAERDVRHAKVKIKVSGCFRSLGGAKEFAKINSVLNTARKHGIAVIDTIMASLLRHLVFPGHWLVNSYN